MIVKGFEKGLTATAASIATSHRWCISHVLHHQGMSTHKYTAMCNDPGNAVVGKSAHLSALVGSAWSPFLSCAMWALRGRIGFVTRCIRPAAVQTMD